MFLSVFIGIFLSTLNKMSSLQKKIKPPLGRPNHDTGI